MTLMKEHDAVFLESISSIALVVLWATKLITSVIVGMMFLGMFAGYISLELSSTQFLSIVFKVILILLCNEAIKFLNDFRENIIEPNLPA